MRQSGIDAADRATLNQIYGLYSAFDAIENQLGELVVQAASDFNQDNNVGYTMFSALPTRLLLNACDHLSALRILSGREPEGMGHWHSSAPWTLLRSALEQASQAIWLATSDQQFIRVERYLRFYRQDVMHRKVAEKQFYRPKDRIKYSKQQDVNWYAFLKAFYADWYADDSAKARISTDMNICECIQVAAIDVGSATMDSAELLWRVASGYAHGFDWPNQTVGRSGVVMDGDQPVEIYSLNPGTLLWLAGLTISTVNHAYWLMRKRCGLEVPATCPPLASVKMNAFKRFVPHIPNS